VEAGRLVARIGDREGAYRVLGRTPEGMRPVVRITLKRIFKKWDGEAWTGLIYLRRGKDAWRL
jgi:hypothetical protein